MRRFTRPLPLLRAILRDDRGATVMEFALLVPTLCIMLMGLFDMGYNLYAASILQGAIHDAARDSTLEGSTPALMDQAVSDAVKNVVPNATVTASRKAYSNLSDVGKPEDFDDANSNGICDNGEVFEDANANGAWDADQGRSGQGSARDVVAYEVTVTYPRAFPIAAFIGMSKNATLTSSTVLRNQPYNQQQAYNATGNCA